MIIRRDNLEQALEEVEAHRLTGVSTVVVSRSWWERLSFRERNEYRRRAEDAALELRVDARLSAHFIELRGDDEGPPLSTEQPM